MDLFTKFISMSLLSVSFISVAEQEVEPQKEQHAQVKQCVLNELLSGDDSQTIADLKNKCKDCNKFIYA